MTSEPTASPRDFRDAYYEALAGGGTALRDASPRQSLLRLVQEGVSAATSDPGAVALLADLAAVAAIDDIDEASGVARERFGTPERFREAIYFARCLLRDTPSALDLLRNRLYLEGASVPEAHTDLHTDRAAVLDATTFASLWREPARAEWALTTVGLWRRDYVAAYQSAHSDYAAEVGAIAEQMDGIGSQASAVEKLNGLRRLGAPVASSALEEFRDLERLFACSLDGSTLIQALAQTPLCPECAFRLGDSAPTADARRVRLAIERGLATQQARLASRVVTKLLARPVGSQEERLQRFEQVVQASDLAGLALVLDEELIAFLRELLEDAEAEEDLLQRLAGVFPEVTAANIDSVVAEFRRLLEADVARAGRLRLGREAGA